MRLAGHLARKEQKMGSAYKVLEETLEGKRHLEFLGIDGRITLNWELRKWDRRIWTGFIWLRIATKVGALGNTVRNFRVP
jgi:hypothetical protein